ncbi:TonB-dependent receptor P3 [Dyadobacter sp. CECT 9275]|uniref:TonB-dependent receptor P3 n=1 Tax=Dyadobacter helix TaxID=2822344 RepID=A0A916JHA6_9BACT|nr:TonB-dependent receptor [Dyadobacter sp. CECT 9275]CAG5016930.1 TonB-dependent receptor P3 [Dyadobacter sp. CECT 9275]
MKKRLFLNPILIRLMTFSLQQVFLVLMLTGVSMAREVSAQELLSRRITLNMENQELRKVLTSIERQAHIKFAYRPRTLPFSQKVSLVASDEPLSTILDKMTVPLQLRYEVIGKQIILKKRTEAVRTESHAEESSRHIIHSADRSLTGKVTDEKGENLPGVSVLLKGTQQGTTTNADGAFTLHIPDENAVLVLSFVGYVSKEIAVGNRTNVEVSLAVDAKSLEEVVVVGYGAQRKATLTGAVAGISSEEVKKSPVVNLSNALTGMIPGVVTTNRTGEPGRDDSAILIRGKSTTGNTNPLIVVDGIQDASGWQRINPNDIASISVLKDASAAIYGARAANGVILITTKRGKVGKPVIDYTFNQGFVNPTRLPKMANSAQFAGYVNELQVKAGQGIRYTDDEIRKFADGSDPLNYPNTDWFGEVLKKVTTQSRHNLNIRGGTDALRFSVSGSYSNEGGIFKNGSLNFKTYTIRSNIDANITKNVKIGLDVNGGLDNGNYPSFSTTTTFQRLWQVPFVPVYYPNGLPSSGIENGENPAVMGTDATGNTNNRSQRFLAKGTFDINIAAINGLGLDGYFAYGNDVITSKNWQTPWTVYDYDKANNTYIPKLGGGILKPQLTQQFTNAYNTLVNLRVKYDRQLGNHHVNTFVAFEQQEGNNSAFSAFRRNYISNSIDELFAGSLVDQSTSGTRSETGRRNFFGRVNYGFKDRYLLDFNFRYDGSAIFPKGKRYGFFPGVSVAWRLSQEDFLKNRRNVDDLKIRASYGKMGNDAVDAFQHLALYSLGNQGYHFGWPSSFSQGLTTGVTPNPNITWEVATSTNVGVDGSFWKGLLGFSVDFFKQRRSNILATRSLAVPVYTGLKLPNENIGVVENQGIDLQLTTSNTVGQVRYSIAGNLGYARNRIIDISEASNIPEWQKAEGHVIGATRYYHALGIFRTQEQVDNNPRFAGTKVGDLQYQDVNGDKVIDAADMIRMDKTNIPELTFGLNASVEYKNFSLWANFAGQSRSWQYYHQNARIAMNALEEFIVNRYTPGSMDSKYPTLPTIEAGAGGEVNGQLSDFWLMNTSFVRLKTLELGYSIPAELLAKLRINSVRLFVNGNNLFTIDKLKIYDPENSNQTGGYYPQSKIFNAGFNLTF